MKSIKFEGTSYSVSWIKAHSRAQFIKKINLAENKAGELYDLVVPPKKKAKEDEAVNVD